KFLGNKSKQFLNRRLCLLSILLLLSQLSSLLDNGLGNLVKVKVVNSEGLVFEDVLQSIEGDLILLVDENQNFLIVGVIINFCRKFGREDSLHVALIGISKIHATVVDVHSQ